MVSYFHLFLGVSLATVLTCSVVFSSSAALESSVEINPASYEEHKGIRVDKRKVQEF
jgi:hypothetical protein